MKPKWLDRRIAATGPYLSLCLDQNEFDACLKHLRIQPGQPYVNPGKDGTAHHITSPSGELCVVVCLSGHKNRTSIEVAGLLVHEAVHAWQAYADMIGETSPGREQEAYAIQSIAQELMSEFARRIATQ